MDLLIGQESGLNLGYRELNDSFLRGTMLISFFFRRSTSSDGVSDVSDAAIRGRSASRSRYDVLIYFKIYEVLLNLEALIVVVTV